MGQESYSKYKKSKMMKLKKIKNMWRGCQMKSYNTILNLGDAAGLCWMTELSKSSQRIQ